MNWIAFEEVLLMKNKILSLYRRHREVISYVFFGGLTTLVNIVCYDALMQLGMPSDPATVTGTVISILFAYFTNRRWVFESRAVGKAAWREFFSFVACRASTLVLDWAIMHVLITMPGREEDRMYCLLIKLAANALVIIVNFIFSKLIVFRKKQ